MTTIRSNTAWKFKGLGKYFRTPFGGRKSKERFSGVSKDTNLMVRLGLLHSILDLEAKLNDTSKKLSCIIQLRKGSRWSIILLAPKVWIESTYQKKLHIISKTRATVCNLSSDCINWREDLTPRECYLLQWNVKASASEGITEEGCYTVCMSRYSQRCLKNVVLW